MAFLGMLAVGFPIPNVVEQVRGTGNQTKTRKGQPASQQVVGFKNAFGKNECGQHKDVFEPFVRAHRADEMRHRIPFVSLPYNAKPK